ncbi:MAG: hypothetical protein DI551_01685 [Micavibrio aeruginosavorus]|uniref:DUF2946 domain-containing protein n=1 Tax=Micavibrio aeruginosavorus TaxID=349221 RepID=A0A2W5NBW4_9BACT|nr:MAG: hypothetical protein DI551_01685 [Micavibrio aeruginosavorus]
MSARKIKISRKKDFAAFAVMTFMLFAVLIKAALPAGFMPTVAKDGFTEIVICSGMGEKTISVPSGDNPEPSHQDNQQTGKVCAFQVLVSGKILLDGPTFTLVAPPSSAVSVDFTNDRTFRSAAVLSFAPRGPPSA